MPKLIRLLRRWLLLELAGREYFSPPFYMADEDRWYPGNWHTVVSKCKGDREQWMCRVQPYYTDNQIGRAGWRIRRELKPGLFWRPYLLLLEGLIK